MIRKIMIVAFLCVVWIYHPLAADLEELSGLAENSDDAVQSATTEAGILDDLSGLADSPENGGLEDLSDSSAPQSDSLSSEASTETSASPEEDNHSLMVNGYLKPLMYWNSTHYADDLWASFQAMKAQGLNAPAHQDENQFTDVGARMQLKLEGFLGDTARLFTAVNVEYNEVTDDDASRTAIRMVEAFIEVFDGSRTWKIGNQLVT
ncbi:MAG: hypothetical protein HQM12_23050, partial [SAR324 cluster bacterium]|nr:hypothetical protein [SAR324 cluster bacterium]